MSQNQLSFASQIRIYDHENLIQNVFKLIQKEVLENNFQLIQKYDRGMVNSSLAKATRHKHLKMILSLSRLLKKDWITITKEDVEDLVYKVMEKYGDESGQETNTTWDHKKVLKIFVRWMKLGSREKNEVGDPPEIKHVKIRRVKDKIARTDLLTESDRTRLLQACEGNERDRAFIDCHFEAGTRPGEILNLQLKHVKFDKYGAVLHVDGKTGPRTIRLVKSTPHLATWIQNHPFRNDPEAPLWPNLSHHNHGTPLTYAGARIMLKKRCKKANLSKRVYMNLFRHSEATFTANFMTEAQMRKRHGWSKDSQMPSRYVHLVNSDVEKAIFSHYGIAKEDSEDDQSLPQNCLYCKMVNSSEATICSQCGKPLDIKTAIQEEEKGRKELDDLKENMESIVDEKIDEFGKRFVKEMERFYEEHGLKLNKELDRMDAEFEKDLKSLKKNKLH